MQKKPDSQGYRWVIVVCCFLMIFISLGFCSGPRKLYMVAVPRALGLDFGPYSFNDSFRYLSTTLMNLAFGAMVMRFGPRRLIAAGFATLAASMMVYASAETLPVIYLGGVLLGIGLTFTTTTMSSYVINIWCPKNKGTITGLVLCANGLGGALAMQVLSPLIQESVFGYRNAYRLSAMILLVVGVLITVVFRNSPQKDEALPGVGKKQAKGDTWEGMTLREALKKPYFYAAAVCVFLTGMVLQSVVGSDANHMNNVGLDAAYVANILSLHSLTLAGCKFLMGVLYDRKGLKITMLICDIAAMIMLLLLIGISNTPAGKGMAACYSVISSLALPLETIMLPLITAELFGRRHYAQMLGIVVAINTAGYSIGPPVTNFVFDALGTYLPIFWLYLLVMAGITAVFMLAITAAQKDRKQAA